MKSNDLFSRIAKHTARAIGHPVSFTVAVLVIVSWAALGPLFGFSDTWQLVINTGTTIVTFLVVFLIQATQNRDSKVLQLKLDELLRAVKGARTSLVDLENLSEDELAALQQEFEKLRKRLRASGKEEETDAGTPTDR